MATTNINYETRSAGTAVTTAEPNVQYVFGTCNTVADSGVGGSNAMECSLAANNTVQMAPTATGNIYIRAYVKWLSSIPASTSYVMTARSYVTVTETIAEVQINSNGTIRIRDKDAQEDVSTWTASADTWYRLEWNVNRTAGTQELRIFEGPHNTSPAETIGGAAGSCNNSTATQVNRLQFGATAAGAAATARYDDTAWAPSADSWIGPSGSSATDHTATPGDALGMTDVAAAAKITVWPVTREIQIG